MLPILCIYKILFYTFYSAPIDPGPAGQKLLICRFRVWEGDCRVFQNNAAHHQKESLTMSLCLLVIGLLKFECAP